MLTFKANIRFLTEPNPQHQLFVDNTPGARNKPNHIEKAQLKVSKQQITKYYNASAVDSMPKLDRTS